MHDRKIRHVRKLNSHFTPARTHSISGLKSRLKIGGERRKSVLPEREIREMFYYLVGILQIISISAVYMSWLMLSRG